MLAARVVADATGRHLLEGGLYLLPIADKEVILGRFRRLHRRFAKRMAGGPDATFFKAHGHEFNLVWLDHVILRPLPQLKTADGEDLIFSRATFSILDEERVRTILTTDPALHPDQSGFVWRAGEGQDGRRLGTWTMGSGRLRFEGYSREQADRARQWIEERASSAIRYRVTSFKPGLGDAPPDRPSPEAEVPSAVTHIVLEHLDKHYREWLDVPVPALDGDTPRHAAARPELRPRVVDLLKQIENGTARGRAQSSGMPGYDVGWMWTELGLTRPDA
jgi:hypothetical protein